MNRFEDLHTFVTVVEAGSFTAAAERLDTAKSAVSRRVSAMEERLGVQLLRRTTRRLNLTDTGKSFYEQGVRILADLNEAESAVTQEHGELRGQLKVALPLSFGLGHMAKPIADFSHAHPNVYFDLDFNDRRVDLIADGVDLAIRISHLADSTLIARKLFDARTIVCASSQYLSRRGIPESPEALVDHDCLVYSNLADPGRWAYTDLTGERRSVPVNVAMRSSSGDFLCAAAIQGQGVVLQPAFIAGPAIARGELTPLMLDYGWPSTPAYAVYPPTRHLSFRVRAFIDFLVERFAGVPYWDQDIALPLAR